MSEENMIVLSKIERQLLLYEIFLHFRGWELDTIFEILPTSRRTLQRDVKDLTDAGLISVTFSKKEQAYVKGDKKLEFHGDLSNKYRNRHLKRLHRLGMLICSLDNDEVSEEERYCRENYATCKDVYRKLFPEVSVRTMQRDFVLMNRLGYHIKYNRRIHYYEFYDNKSSYRTEFGVVKEDGKLKRMINNGEYDYPEQYLPIDMMMDPDTFFDEEWDEWNYDESDD